VYSLASTGIATPGDSPPAAPHTVASNAAIKNQMAVRNPHLRHAARAAASPYSREAHSLSGSEAEQDDLAMYLSSSAPADYSSMYMQPSHHMPPTAAPHHLAAHPQDPASAAASFGRMSLSTDMTLEHLAGNVRAATTTSASDRAKQIFVQAWYVYSRFRGVRLLPVHHILAASVLADLITGSAPIMPPILMEMYPGKASTFHIDAFVNSIRFHISTLPPSERQLDSVSQQSRLAVSASEETASIIVSFKIALSTNNFIDVSTDCGIRPATATEAEWLQEYIRRSNNHAGLPAANMAARPNAGGQMNQQSYTREGSRSDGDDDDDDGSEGNSSSGQQAKAPSKSNSLSLPVKSPTLYPMDISDKTPTTNSLQSQAAARPSDTSFGQTPAQIRRRSTGPPAVQPSAFGQNPASNGVSYLGNHQSGSVRSLPNFPNIDDAVGTNSSSPQGVIAREVWRWFEDHLDSLLENVRSFRFDQFEISVRAFWSSLSGDHKEVVHAPAVAGLMARADALVYDVSSIIQLTRSCIYFVF